MKTGTPRFLDRSTLVWLFGAALVVTLPHTLHQPLWLSLAAALCLGWRVWLWRQGLSLPSRWLKVFLVLAATAGMLVQYRTLLGREAGTAFLFLLASLKLLELRTRRDAYALIYLCFFLLLTYFLQDQSLFTGLWMFLALFILIATLLCLHGADGSRIKPPLIQAAKLLAQALPFMVVMYLLFPRITSPLWALPKDEASARTGLPEQMAPGTIASLAQNNEIAFRARFPGPPPPLARLYWRGPVLDSFDGRTWRPGPYRGPRPILEQAANPVSYEMTLEPHRQRWLLALDAPARLPPGSYLTPRLTAMTQEPVLERRVYTLISALQYTYNRQEQDSVLANARYLPPESSPRSRALLASWQAQGLSQTQLVARALKHFRDENFTYTLQPPPLGEQPVDDFLFNTRQGFCEHYAAAFTVLMRAAGIPARVVAGYQGGEINPVDGYLVVRQSDAHAWAEIWLAGQGWLRVDPTAAISPSRIESGLNAALPPGDMPGLIQGNAPWLRDLRHRWEALNNTWNQWVLGYNQQKQENFLLNLGLEDIHWSQLISWLVSACCALLIAFLAITLYQRPEPNPARRLWRQALKTLAKRGIQIQAGETPLALAQRVGQASPPWAAQFQEVAAAYSEARFGPAPERLERLREAVRQFVT